jgi:hypothetical protein
MASLVGGLLGQLKPFRRRGPSASGKGRIGQVVLRGASKRAYTFEVYPREAAASFWEVGAVYAYGRRAGLEATVTEVQLGYVGRTGNLAWQDAEHDRLGHFIGHDFDVLLVQRIEQEPIRLDIEQDLIGQHQPVLNELLCGYKTSGVS